MLQLKDNVIFKIVEMECSHCRSCVAFVLMSSSCDRNATATELKMAFKILVQVFIENNMEGI